MMIYIINYLDIMAKNILIIAICFLLLLNRGHSQQTFPINDIKDKRPNTYLFKNATIFIDYKTKIEKASLLVKDGYVVEVGKDIKDDGMTVIDLKGKYIYPSFIDLYSHYGIELSTENSVFQWNKAEQINSNLPGAYNANQAIRAHYKAVEEFTISKNDAKKMRSMGFGSSLAHKPDGIIRGTSVLLSLGETSDNEVILQDNAAMHGSLQKGSSTQSYPISVMGSIALLRQTYYDAIWYKEEGHKNFQDNSLSNFNAYEELPKIFEAKSMLDILRLSKIANEFGDQYIVKTNGKSYQRIQDIKQTKTKLIIPIQFPSEFKDINDPFKSEDISYSDMKHWEMAPFNPAILEKNQIEFSITATGHKKPEEFLKSLRKAIDHGLSEQQALKSLTHNPARFINAQTKIGSLKPNMVANFFISSGNILDKESEILSTWIQGKEYPIYDIKHAFYHRGL